MKKSCKNYWYYIFCVFLLFIGVLNADAEMANLTGIEHQWVSNHPISALRMDFFLQSSVIVLNKDSVDIKNLSDLDGKHLTVIQDYTITKKLAQAYPNIQQVPVKGVISTRNNLQVNSTYLKQEI